MKIIHSASELNAAGRKVCLAIGFFDGVHLGHQQIIRQTVSDARQHEAIALVITFDQHPNAVVAPEHTPPLIYSLEQKLSTLESLGPDALLLIHFDKAFSEQSGEAFIRSLWRNLGPIQSICVGANFVFGHKRGGNVELLKKLGAELNFTVHGLGAVSLDGKPISSTRIRQAIQSGDLDSAGQMLGRAYSLAGTVCRGDGLGRQLGVPTANLSTAGLVLPPSGVYAAHATLLTTVSPRPSPLTPHPSLQSWRAVVNIGHRPTLEKPTPELRVEAHLLDFQGDLYGQELKLVFVEKLRDEKKFSSLDELRGQIARDIREAQSRF
jgi:riboflavin kinase/FMN adenylyltransferase